MAYDEGLAQRIREVLEENSGLVEKKMFGGIAFMLQGNMSCGVIGEELIVRVGPERFEAAIGKSHTRAFDFSGRPMKGWIVVESEGYESDRDLENWIGQGVDYALSLPAK